MKKIIVIFLLFIFVTSGYAQEEEKKYMNIGLSINQLYSKLKRDSIRYGWIDNILVTFAADGPISYFGFQKDSMINNVVFQVMTEELFKEMQEIFNERLIFKEGKWYYLDHDPQIVIEAIEEKKEGETFRLIYYRDIEELKETFSFYKESSLPPFINR